MLRVEGSVVFGTLRVGCPDVEGAWGGVCSEGPDSEADFDGEEGEVGECGW